MTKTKKILLIFSFSFFVASGFYLNLTISNNCKTIKIFSSIKDFGLSHIDSCYSRDNFFYSVKKLSIACKISLFKTSTALDVKWCSSR